VTVVRGNKRCRWIGTKSNPNAITSAANHLSAQPIRFLTSFSQGPGVGLSRALRSLKVCRVYWKPTAQDAPLRVEDRTWWSQFKQAVTVRVSNQRIAPFSTPMSGV
jgi:hypothetical protein